MKLIAYRTGESGGMAGGRSSTSVAYTDDGRCQVIDVNQVFHNEPIVTMKYYADGLLEKISEVCERHNVITWTNLPGEKIFIHDAPSGKDVFTFEDGTTIILESGRAYPDYVLKMYNELFPLIKEAKSYGVDFEVTEEIQQPMSLGMFMQDMNAQKVQVTDVQSMDLSEWAKFCTECGAEFVGTQKFCAECGSKRKKIGDD